MCQLTENIASESITSVLEKPHCQSQIQIIDPLHATFGPWPIDFNTMYEYLQDSKLQRQQMNDIPDSQSPIEMNNNNTKGKKKKYRKKTMEQNKEHP